MSSTTRVFLGDLVLALKHTGAPEGENWPQIFSLLRFDCIADVSLGDSSTPSTRRQGIDQTNSRTPTEKNHSPPVTADSQDIGKLIAFDVERTAAPAESLPQVPVPTIAPRRSTPPMLQPLLDPLWERGILIEAVGRPVAEGDIAVLEAVELMARGEPLRDVPREKMQSVSKGCQLLIDTGAGMRPFASDTRQLAAAVRKAVGAYHTRVLTFLDSPLHGVLTENYDDEAYSPPENGAVVLAVSDLCGGGPGSAIRRAESADWLKVARLVHDAGSTLVVLNPYPRERWPAEVAEQVPVVYWDRSARTAEVRRTRRRTRR